MAKQPNTLLTPARASKLARDTGRFVGATDGKVYSGAAEKEGAEATRETSQTCGAIDAIALLSEMPAPEKWLGESHDFQLRDLDRDKMRRARDWIDRLLEAAA